MTQASKTVDGPAVASPVRDVDRRVTGVALIAAGALALVGNLVHPRYSGVDADIYREIAGSTAYVTADCVLLIAFLLLTFGLTGLLDSARGGTLVRAARLAVAIGGAIAIVQFGVEVYGLRQQARIFVNSDAANQGGAFWSTLSTDYLNRSLFATWTVVLLGAAPILASLALRRAQRAPIWLTVVGVLGGAICAAVGAFNLLHEDQGASKVPFLVGSLLITVWILASGWLTLARGSAAQLA